MSEKPRESPNKSGPYVVLAVICERVLQEKDDVLSVIRVIDRVTAVPPADTEAVETMPRFVVAFNLVVSLRAGVFEGEYPVEVRAIPPDGDEEQTMVETTVSLDGGETGANLVIQLSMQAKKPGLYWFDVTSAGTRLTSVPLRIIYEPGGPESAD